MCSTLIFIDKQWASDEVRKILLYKLQASVVTGYTQQSLNSIQ